MNSLVIQTLKKGAIGEQQASHGPHQCGDRAVGVDPAIAHAG
jgi:hypothetical protein